MRAVVDTSFWIDYSRGKVTAGEKETAERLWRFGGGVLYQFVWLELVVGFQSSKEQKTLRDLRTISRWEPMQAEDAVKAEAFAATLRAKGRRLTASDLLVMAAADRIGAKIIHHDGDFTAAFALPEFAHLQVPAP